MEVKVFDLMLERMNEAIDSLVDFQKEVLDELTEDKRSPQN